MLRPAGGGREAGDELAQELLAVAHADTPVRETAPVAHALDCELHRLLRGHRAQEVDVQRGQRALLGRARGGERRAAEDVAAERAYARGERGLSARLEREDLLQRRDRSHRPGATG